MVIEINGKDVIVFVEHRHVWLRYSNSSIEISAILPKGRGMTLMEKIESMSGELSEYLSTNILKDAV